MTRAARPLKWIEVDLRAVRHNLAWVRRRLERSTRLMAVVKANAYGHGAVPVARAALEAGASCLGVLTVDEALELRRAGLRAPIVVLAPPLPQEAGRAARADLEVTVDSRPLLAALDRAAVRPVRVHIDVDNGLSRWGIPAPGLAGFLRRLPRFRRLRLAGLSTHFDYVPGKNAVEAEEKLRAFQKLSARLKDAHPGVLCHAANSSVFLDFPHRRFDMVRIGNLMYGINPTATEAALRNPWRFYVRIISLAEIRKGEPIGYASEYVAPRRMTVAALPAGYADGLTMEPAERLIGFGKGYQYWGWLRGRKAPFVGRCGIAHLLVDVSEVPSPRLGEAVLLPVRRTGASARIPRVYVAGRRPRRDRRAGGGS